MVNNGGKMTVTGSSFSRSGSSGYENVYIQVSAGGEMTATGSYFGLDNLYLNAGSLVTSTDLSNNTFNAIITTRIIDRPLLTNN